MAALKDELARSMEQLRLESMDKPYFISYRVQDWHGLAVTATFGALLTRTETLNRYLGLEVRVGDPKLDNTNFASMGMARSGVSSGRGFVSLPLEDDYKEFRRQIWLATDAAYKRALEDLSRKRAALQNKRRSEDTPDFSQEPPEQITDRALPTRMPPMAALEDVARDLSALFRESPAVFTSHVGVQVAEVLTRYVNSEGMTYTRRQPEASVLVAASTQASDGMPLDDYLAAYSRAFEDLPKKPDLMTGVRDLAARLARLREAAVLDRYNGPVLFEDQAAAEVFHQAFASRLPGIRPPLFDNEAMAGAFANENPLLEKLGARVLPTSMTLVDDPTLGEHVGKQLLGGQVVDDDGVRCRRTVVVEKGVLKTLLTSRSPVRGIERSTGHRKGATPAPTNLVLSDDKGISADALKAELLKRVKDRGLEYGIVVRRLGHPFYGSHEQGFGPPFGGREGARISAAILALKVFPDGREELVRNLEPSDLSHPAFKEIVAAGQGASVYTVVFDSRNASSMAALRMGFLPGDALNNLVSLVVPSLLFDDLTLQKPTREIPKLPALKHPFFER
jgi:predicted Zn-dependent protease